MVGGVAGAWAGGPVGAFEGEKERVGFLLVSFSPLFHGKEGENPPASQARLMGVLTGAEEGYDDGHDIGGMERKEERLCFCLCWLVFCDPKKTMFGPF